MSWDTNRTIGNTQTSIHYGSDWGYSFIAQTYETLKVIPMVKITFHNLRKAEIKEIAKRWNIIAVWKFKSIEIPD